MPFDGLITDYVTPAITRTPEQEIYARAADVWLTPDLYGDGDNAIARGLGFDSADSAAQWNNDQEDGAWAIARLRAAAG